MVANNAFIIKEMEEKAEKRGEEKAEKRKAIEIARNLLDVLDDEIIALKTGLDIEEVREIRKEGTR